jgi:hypothetical protein
MPITRTTVVALDDLSHSSGEATAFSSAIDVSSAYAIIVNLKLTHGATAPTHRGVITVQVSPDEGNSGTYSDWYHMCQINGAINYGSGSSYYGVFALPPAIQWARVAMGTNAGGSPVVARASFTLVTEML